MAKTEPIAQAPARKFLFVGKDLGLDFCNTVGGKRGARVREYLNSYADFVSWCQQAALVDKTMAEALRQKASRHPGEAASVLSRAIALREGIYRVFSATAQHKTPQQTDLSRLNSELADSLGRLRVAPGRQGFEWQWSQEDGSLDHPLGPIARSAANLLTCGELLDQVRQCEGDNCGWLFVDSSKNHSRRWCDMRDCGNRAKVRRHRLKQRRTHL
jgi:predicted RNA-binding Zn ribbon-like protein